MPEPKFETETLDHTKISRPSIIKVEKGKHEVVSTGTSDGRSVWPAEDYYEGDDIYDELYPQD